MIRVEVRLDLPGGARTVGHLLDDDRRVHFEYAADFLGTGLQLSPFKLPLGTGVRSEGFPEFHGLYGLFYDSLPDGWGLLLMHRRMRARGIDPQRLSVLAWLRYLGTRAMGALTYHPAEGPEQEGALEVALDVLANEALAVFEGRAEEVLPELELAGGSPGGARPKVVVAIGPKDRVIAGAAEAPPGYRQWLVKFAARDDLPGAAALEELYAQLARAAGLRAPNTRLFPLKRGRQCFASERFDRDGPGRIHMHTIGGLLHASHRAPSLDYEDLLKATGLLTHSQGEVIEAFRRMCFNVLACNRDDHVRNFSYLMSPSGEWTLSPAYDLVYSEGMRGHHTTSVRGEALRPARKAVLELAHGASIPAARAKEIISQVADAVARFPALAKKLKLPRSTASRVAARLSEVQRDFERR